MLTDKRRRKLAQLKSLAPLERGLLANARCLSEGVDVPSLDGAPFIDPRSTNTVGILYIYTFAGAVSVEVPAIESLWFAEKPVGMRVQLDRVATNSPSEVLIAPGAGGTKKEN